jgi:hypothetical protein
LFHGWPFSLRTNKQNGTGGFSPSERDNEKEEREKEIERKRGYTIWGIHLFLSFEVWT